METDLKEWLEVRLSHFATKTELAEMKGDLRSEIQEAKADVIKWMFIFWVGQLAATVAVFKLIR